MSTTLRAFVRNKRLIMNEPTELLEGTELELTAADPADELDEKERSRLHAALQQSWASTQLGRTFPAEKILRKLKGERLEVRGADPHSARDEPLVE